MAITTKVKIKSAWYGGLSVDQAMRFNEIEKENVQVKAMDGGLITIPKKQHSGLGSTASTKKDSGIKCNYDLLKLNPEAGMLIRVWIFSLK